MKELLTTEQKTCVEMNMVQFQKRISRIVEESYLHQFKTKKVQEIFSEGKNSKLAARVSILNLPPIATCPNCATCAGSCYATLRYGDTTHVQPRWDKNLAMTMREDFVEMATRELKYKGTTIVRYHESGDFYSEQYIDKCMELAIANPQVFFYGYTKVKSALRLNALTNVNVIYSLIETPIGEIRNYGTKEYCEMLEKDYDYFVCPHDKTWKEKGLSCMGTCEECKTRDKVCFEIHGREAKKDTYSKVILDKLNKKKNIVTS